MKMEQIECSETSAYKIQTPGNYPEEIVQHTEHSESLKSRTSYLVTGVFEKYIFSFMWRKLKTETLRSSTNPAAHMRILCYNLEDHTRN
jgi:hypothetical protein